MIQRRQFITTAAGLATAAVFARKGHADPVGRNLNWYCDTIKTVAHTKSDRRPVVTGVALQKTGDLLAIVGDDHYVCIYDLTQKTITQHNQHHNDWVRASKFSPDGKRLATAGNDRKLIVTDIDDIARPVIEKRHPEAIIAIAYSNDGSKLATVGFESKLRIYDAQSGQRIAEQNCDCSDNRCVAFSADDKLIAVGGRSGVIKVWSVDGMAEIASYKKHRQRVRSISFTADNQILSAGEDQVVRLTDPRNLAVTKETARLGAKLFATQIIDTGYFATGGSDNHVHVWNINAMAALGSLTGHTGTVSCLDAKENILVSGSYDASVRIWRTEMDSSAMNLPVVEDRHTKVPEGWNPKATIPTTIK